MNSWYETDDWYAPLIDEEEASREDEKKQKRKKFFRVIGALLIVAAMISATALSYTNMIRRAAARQNEQAEEDFGEYPENYQDFFSRYYTAEETKSTKISIPRAGEKVSFSLVLERQGSIPLTLQELYQACSPAIVAIAGYQKGVIGYNWGTGIVLSEDGLVLTNTHVIDGCDRAEVIFEDDVRYTAALIGADATSDIALLKIEASGLPAASFGDSVTLSVGDSVAAIGNPLGGDFARTLTNGIISAIDRDIMHEGHKMTLLQTNTALNEGNSGGALFNMSGQVIGITNMKMTSSSSATIEGIGFAIPSSTVKAFVESLLADGEVRGRPSIGITVGEIPEEAAEQYHLPGGLYIASVTEGTDAWKKGLRKGDIILEANGVPVARTNELNDIKNQLKVGDAIDLKVWRNEKELHFSVRLMDTNEVYG